MTGSIEYLSVQPNAREELTGFFQFQDEVIVLPDLDIGIGFRFEEFSQLWNEVSLAFQQEKLCPLIFEFLCETGMVRMKMCDKQILDLIDRNPFSLELCR